MYIYIYIYIYIFIYIYIVYIADNYCCVADRSLNDKQVAATIKVTKFLLN